MLSLNAECVGGADDVTFACNAFGLFCRSAFWIARSLGGADEVTFALRGVWAGLTTLCQYGGSPAQTPRSRHLAPDTTRLPAHTH